MNIEILTELLTDYGLPTVLTLLFIILYKNQNDKQTKYLLKTISELNDKEKYINDLKDSIDRNTVIINSFKSSIDNLKSVIENCLKPGKK